MPTTQNPAALIQAKIKSIGTISTGSTTGPTTGSNTGTTTPVAPLILTKFQFRKLFTLEERTTIDNIQYNTAFSGSVKAIVNTLMRDLEVSGEVDLHLSDVITGVNFLRQIGILSSARATQILANQSPA